MEKNLNEALGIRTQDQTEALYQQREKRTPILDVIKLFLRISRQSGFPLEQKQQD